MYPVHPILMPTLALDHTPFEAGLSAELRRFARIEGVEDARLQPSRLGSTRRTRRVRFGAVIRSHRTTRPAAAGAPCSA